MKLYVSVLMTMVLAGCAATPPASPIGDFRYEDVRFAAQEGHSQDAARFKADITACHDLGQRKYESDLKNAKTLSQIYGQSVTPAMLAALRKLMVVDCMTGNATGARNGKGWVIAKGR